MSHPGVLREAGGSFTEQLIHVHRRDGVVCGNDVPNIYTILLRPGVQTTITAGPSRPCCDEPQTQLQLPS